MAPLSAPIDAHAQPRDPVPVITTRCDRCDAPLSFPDDHAGRRVPCPHCGDINRLAEATTPPEVIATPGVPKPKRADRAAAAGFPPDHGPEQPVRLVRPAMLRARPLSFAVASLLLVGGLAAGLAFLIVTPLAWASVLGGLVALVGGIWLGVWKVLTLAAGLEITTKRTIERRGLFRRDTSEVLHDNIRNIQVNQTFWQRVWNVGGIGISSSGQDGIEVQMKDIPRPRDLQRIIDLYRPL